MFPQYARPARTGIQAVPTVLATRQIRPRVLSGTAAGRAGIFFSAEVDQPAATSSAALVRRGLSPDSAWFGRANSDSDSAALQHGCRLSPPEPPPASTPKPSRDHEITRSRTVANCKDCAPPGDTLRPPPHGLGCLPRLPKDVGQPRAVMSTAVPGSSMPAPWIGMPSWQDDEQAEKVLARWRLHGLTVK